MPLRRIVNDGEHRQGVTGGVEEDESLVEAARREPCEETRIVLGRGCSAIAASTDVLASVGTNECSRDEPLQPGAERCLVSWIDS